MQLTKKALMHSTNIHQEAVTSKSEEEILLVVATLITEGRIPEKFGPKSKGFREGPHSFFGTQTNDHECDSTNTLCFNYETAREKVTKLWAQQIPPCVEVFLTCGCQKEDFFAEPIDLDKRILLESWNFHISGKSANAPVFNLNQLFSAIRSQLYFSQITAWLTTQDDSTKRRLTNKHLRHNVVAPQESLGMLMCTNNFNEHKFPTTDIGGDRVLNVSYCSMPRVNSFPMVQCPSCTIEQSPSIVKGGGKEIVREIAEVREVVDDRMHMLCTLKGKHHCEDFEEVENATKLERSPKFKRFRQNLKEEQPSTSMINHLHSCLQKSRKEFVKSLLLERSKHLTESEKSHFYNNDLKEDEEDKGKILLDAIERVGLRSKHDVRLMEVQYDDETMANRKQNRKKKGLKNLLINDLLTERGETNEKAKEYKCGCDNVYCDTSKSDKCSNKNKFNVYTDKKICDSPIPIIKHVKIKDISNYPENKHTLSRKISFDDNETPKGSNGIKKENTGVVVEGAASTVFNSKTGLPLASSPAPVRKGRGNFGYDSTLNSVSAIKNSISSSLSTDEESESDGSMMSPSNLINYSTPHQKLSESDPKYPSLLWHKKSRKCGTNLLGSFEESLLNGRFDPVSTVHGFTAELGASGSFVPKHLVAPVTVFFYNLGDYDRLCSPYLCHINLGKKGYSVPKQGNVQVTLFNPHGTVVKIFVVIYDLSDMPPNTQTFVRQRTLYLPNNCKDYEMGPKWLKYLIHLRFVSSKSGKIALHTDIRIMILNKSDLDTATALAADPCYELRSFTVMPDNPRYSPRK